MRIISDITGLEYSSIEECEKAEKEYKTKQELKAKEEAEKTANISKRKKELAKEIDDASAKLEEANKLYEVAKSKAAEILEKSNKEVKDILDTASKEVKEAEKKKFEAILKFNKEFGTYTTTYTGEKAAEEYYRSIKRFDDIFKDIWKSF